jgi:MOSC domain-containing protein YiiM
MIAERTGGEAIDTVEIVGVNVGVPRVLAEGDGERVYSAIAKQPVPMGTTLWLSLLNLAGDGQADLTVHGGPDKAVYAYASEHLTEWEGDLENAALGPAPFGENLSTRGVLEADVGIGDVWQWNDALLQVCQPRWPCYKLALYRRRADIQALMRATGRTGWYLRVIQPGAVVAGARIEVVQRDPARFTVADAHTAMGDRRLLNRALVVALADHEALAAQWREPLQDRLGRH